MTCAPRVEVALTAPDGSFFERLFYQVGYTAGRVESYVSAGTGHPSTMESRPRSAVPDAGAQAPQRRRRARARTADEAPADLGAIRSQMQDAMKGAAETWLVRRVLKPRSISWPAVLFAGLAATALSDTVSFFTVPGRPSPYDEKPENLIARYGAGIATTAAYAAVLYPRLPGRPLTRGFLFALLDVVTEPEGGLIALGRWLVPELHFPLKPFALPVNEDAGPMARLAFGLGLGLFYRAR